MPNPTMLSRGHQAEVRFAEQMGLPYPGSERDYRDAVTDEYLQGITSREDFIGFEHLVSFFSEACADIQHRPEIMARQIVNPRVYRWSNLSDEPYTEEIDPAEIGLIARPRQDVGFTPEASPPWSFIDTDARAIQVGSLINFIDSYPESFAQLGTYREEYVAVLRRLAAFLEAKIKFSELIHSFDVGTRIMEHFAKELGQEKEVYSWDQRMDDLSFTRKLAVDRVRDCLGHIKAIEAAMTPAARARLYEEADDA